MHSNRSVKDRFCQNPKCTLYGKSNADNVGLNCKGQVTVLEHVHVETGQTLS